MKKLNNNQKISIIALAIFILFLIVFSVLSSLVQSGAIPDFAVNQRIQGLLAFITFSPLLTAVFFVGRHFKSNNSEIGKVLIFVSVALFVFGTLQTLLSLLGAYGS